MSTIYPTPDYVCGECGCCWPYIGMAAKHAEDTGHVVYGPGYDGRAEDA